MLREAMDAQRATGVAAPQAGLDEQAQLRRVSTSDPQTTTATSRLARASSGNPKNLAVDTTVIEMLELEDIPEQISFFQRWFTIPVVPSADSRKSARPGLRRFSLLAPGPVLCAAVLLIVAILVAVSVTLAYHPPRHLHTLQGSPIELAILANFPDPAILQVNGTWYAFGTNNAAGVLGQGGEVNASAHTPDFGLANIQLATSPDFQTWTVAPLQDAPLPRVGAWAAGHTINANHPGQLSTTWAPSLIRRDDGKYVLYYAAKIANASTAHPGTHCIGAAISQSFAPIGPFDALNETLACPVDQGGAIDVETLRDVDGEIYLVWKVDGNSIGHGGECANMVPPYQPTPIMLQRMQADGITPAADAIMILDRVAEDGPLVEAPKLIRSDEGIYFLFYSSGCTRDPDYTVRYATADAVTGPYVRAPRPLLRTGDFGLVAPGSVGIGKDGEGRWKMAFAARVDDGLVGKVRAMYTTGLALTSRKVKLVPGS